MRTLETLAELEEVCNGGKVVIVDFYANWCGPCKMIGPKVEAMSQLAEFKDVEFCKVDVDENDEAASKYDVTALPTFVIFSGGKVVKRVVGASEANVKSALQEVVQQHGQ